VNPTGPRRIGPAAAVVLDVDGTLVEWPTFLNAEFEAARARALGRIRALFPAARRGNTCTDITGPPRA
jgi:FMN phosphatase YigB (HAD superfamily)